MLSPESTTEMNPAHLELVHELMRILALQIEGHGRLHSCMTRKREAIRLADLDAITSLCQEENLVVNRLGDLEKERLTVLGDLTATLEPDAARSLTVRQLAPLVPEPRRSNLLELAEKLRSEIEVVRKESSVVRAAAESLSRHLAGIVQTVHSALSRAGVYERRGRVFMGTQMEFFVDVKT